MFRRISSPPEPGESEKVQFFYEGISPFPTLAPGGKNRSFPSCGRQVLSVFFGGGFYQIYKIGYLYPFVLISPFDFLPGCSPLCGLKGQSQLWNLVRNLVCHQIPGSSSGFEREENGYKRVTFPILGSAKMAFARCNIIMFK